MHRILYLIQKEFRQIIREKAFIGIIFVMPFIQIVILGFAITTDVKNVAIGFVDHDHTSMSRRLTDAFIKTESFTFSGYAASSKQAIEWLDRGKVKLVMIIPPNFERDIKDRQKPSLQILLDGVDGNSTGISMAYSNQIISGLQQDLVSEASISGSGPRSQSPVSILTRMMYNESLESINHIIPGIIGLLITIITAFLTGMSIVREKEIGTLEQLMVTPIRKFELILGKIFPFLLVSLLLVSVGILAAGLIFGLWMRGSVMSLYAMSVVFSLSTLGLGIFASTLAKTQQQSMFIVWFFMVVSLLLSGFFVPIENMPKWVQTVTYLNPLRYFMIVIREIYLKGTPLIYLWKEALAMLVFGLTTFFLATLRFSKRVS